MSRYVMERRRYVRCGRDHDIAEYACTLREMSERELRDAIAAAPENVTYERVPAYVAHRHVRGDGIHSTGLWIDNGRIRYAKEE